MLCAALICAACGTPSRIDPGGATTRSKPIGNLPATPANVSTPPGPAILATTTPYGTPTFAEIADWQAVYGRISGAWRIVWRVPQDWQIVGARRASIGEDEAISIATFTPLKTANVTVASYLADLADGTPISQYTSTSGFTFYVLERTISVAPTDPDAETAVFHTAVVVINGRIAKLEVTYPNDNRFRFADTARTIIGSADVMHS